MSEEPDLQTAWHAACSPVLYDLLRPFLDLGWQYVLRPACLCHAGLALDGFGHQRRLALGRPVLEFFFHHRPHIISLARLWPVQIFSGS